MKMQAIQTFLTVLQQIPIAHTKRIAQNKNTTEKNSFNFRK